MADQCLEDSGGSGVVINAIGTRELITLDGPDMILRATYHTVCKEDFSVPAEPINRTRIGVLFLGSLSPTRAATGDSAVYWADSFAKSGYPSFRLDLPGFGDSDGDPPAGLLELIDTGGFAPVVSAKAREIVERFGLSGVILVGLCAGALSAIFGARVTKECRGLILIDPYFHLPLGRRSKIWEKLTGRISRSLLGRGIENLCDRLKTYWVLLTGSKPPANANFPLLNCWKDVASAGLPIILFKASPGFRQRGEFDFINHVLKLAGRKSRVVVRVIEGAGHTFSDCIGRCAVRENVENWLAVNFAPSVLEKNAGGPSLSKNHDSRSDNSIRELHPQDVLVLKGR
jgi:pimeloyl-ACP methyl ester carboxylesterase